jgi:hypothetical protein
MRPIILLVLCPKRALNAIVDELEDWKQEGVQVKLYGITPKAHDGFILMEWSKPIPESFQTKLQVDDDILDYLTIDAAFQSVHA